MEQLWAQQESNTSMEDQSSADCASDHEQPGTSAEPGEYIYLWTKVSQKKLCKLLIAVLNLQT